MRELLYLLSKNSNKIEVTIPKQISAKDPDWDVVICDEADYLFEQKNFVFFKHGGEIIMNGLYRTFFAKNLILMSARFNTQ